MKLADAFGIRGMRVGSPAALTGAVREAIAGNEPCLIEVPVGEMESMRNRLAQSAPMAARP